MGRAVLIAGIFAAVLSPAAPPGEGGPPDPWPGPRGDYVFVEAEDFTLPPQGWAVQDSHIHGRTDTQSNLKFLAGNLAGAGAATKTIVVPSEGAYRFWVNHSQASGNNPAKRGPFRVSLSQAGKEVFVRDYLDADAKAEPAKAGFPLFHWEAVPVTLARGEATVTIHKSGPESPPGQTRLIDCLLWTKDPAYEPNYRDFAPQTYLRIRLIGAEPGALYFYGFLNHMRKPWYGNITLGNKGLRSGPGLTPKDFVLPGTSTGWVNLSRFLYSGSDTNLALEARGAAPRREILNCRYAVEFATAPDEAGIVATFERQGPGSGLMLRMPPDLTGTPRPKSDLQFAADNLELARKTAAGLTFGKLPERFPILADIRADEVRSTPGVRKTELQALRSLGLNGIRGVLREGDVEEGVRFGRPGLPVHSEGEGGFNNPQQDRMKGSIVKVAAELAGDPNRERYVAASMSDEAHPPELEAMIGHPVHEKAFLEWLKSQGREAKDFGVAQWSEAALTSDRNSRTPALYLASQRFRAWSIVQFFRRATQLARPALPATVPSTQNFSDGAVYNANFYGQGNDYFTWFRNEALDLAWSEDWSNGSSTPQLCGWNVALLRAATRERGQRIGMYVIAGHKRKPLDVKLKAYSDLAQGARVLEIYPYSAPYGSHESSWYLQPQTYSAVAQLTREIGAAEHVLLDALPRKAETVILYSRASDIWNADHDSIDGHERMHTYLAFRHAQIAVDVLDEDDVAGGGLAGRRVAYLFGEQLDRRCAAPLVQWVRDGGTLVLSPGAGGRNELNAADGTLDRDLDISRSPVVREKIHWGRSRDLGNLKALGSVQVPDTADEKGGRFEYAAVRQALTARDGDAIGARFESGKPALVTRSAGRGRVVTAGFLPAVSYIRGALQAVSRMETEPRDPKAAPPAIDGEDIDAGGKQSAAAPASAFSKPLRDLIGRPARAAAGPQPVELDLPLVEATFLEGAAGWVVPLANYTGAPAVRLTLTVRTGDRAFGDVRSSRQGILKSEKLGESAVRFVLPLDSTDMVFAEWAARK